MTLPLKFALSATLLLIAVLHALWGLGVWFPVGDEAQLAKMVVGTKGIDKMPGPAASFLAAPGIFAAATLPWWPHGRLQRLALYGVIAVFVLRGGAAYVPTFRQFSPEEPFATLDMKFYAPLCLLLGAGFAMLARRRPRAI